jgi:hypothetical protein
VVNARHENEHIRQHERLLAPKQREWQHDAIRADQASDREAAVDDGPQADVDRVARRGERRRYDLRE